MNRRDILAATATTAVAATTGCISSGQADDRPGGQASVKAVGESHETEKFRLTLDWVKRTHVVTHEDGEEEIELREGDEVALGGFTVENISGEVQQTLDSWIYFFADGERQKPVTSLPYAEGQSVPTESWREPDGKIELLAIGETDGYDGNTLGELHAGMTTTLWIATLLDPDASLGEVKYQAHDGSVKATWSVTE